MAYQVLYRTYRPSRFDEVVGQDYIIKTLKNAIKLNKIAHAYLFCGPRGTGKTSVAKLFAKAINCESFNEESCNECQSCQGYLDGNHPDIIELDAASNNSVDNIRQIVDEVSYAPLLGKYKVYIIDEVHMLSGSAFNALLKTLEEPPAHVVFILATTDPQKVIPTVLSRCQRYNFNKITTYDIRKKLIEILNKENIKFEEAAVDEIARLAEGGMRDALSILEQCLSYNESAVLLEDIEKIFGLTSTATQCELLIKTHQSQISEVIATLREMYRNGIDTQRLALDLLEIIKEALIYSDRADDSLLTKISRIEAQQLLGNISVSALLKDAEELEETISRDRQSQSFLSYLELCLIKMGNIENKAAAIATNTNIEKNETPIKKTETETIPEPVISEPEETETAVEETVAEESIEEIKTEKYDKDFLVGILFTANKDEKINDGIIYNRLDLYKLEPEKRKFYSLLKGTRLFASGPEAIIIEGTGMQADNINQQENNEDIYHFLNDEFGIDKMVYAIDEETKKEISDLYRRYVAEKNVYKVKIERYKTRTGALSTEDKLRELFGDVKVEE